MEPTQTALTPSHSHHHHHLPHNHHPHSHTHGQYSQDNQAYSSHRKSARRTSPRYRRLDLEHAGHTLLEEQENLGEDEDEEEALEAQRRARIRKVLEREGDDDDDDDDQAEVKAGDTKGELC